VRELDLFSSWRSLWGVVLVSAFSMDALALFRVIDLFGMRISFIYPIL
jgi:hypothetical protein